MRVGSRFILGGGGGGGGSSDVRCLAREGGGGGRESKFLSCCNTVMQLQNPFMQALILWGARLSPLRILEGPGPSYSTRPVCRGFGRTPLLSCSIHTNLYGTYVSHTHLSENRTPPW